MLKPGEFVIHGVINMLRNVEYRCANHHQQQQHHQRQQQLPQLPHPVLGLVGLDTRATRFVNPSAIFLSVDLILIVMLQFVLVPVLQASRVTVSVKRNVIFQNVTLIRIVNLLHMILHSR
jgi:hypothetical protein